MSRLFEAVAAYEAALEVDDAATDAFKEARDSAERELQRLRPDQFRGSSFEYAEDDMTDDRLYWDGSGAGALVPIKKAPKSVQRAARIFGVAEALAADREATGRRHVATDRMLRTPCEDDRDLLEKFRALGLDEHNLVDSTAYEAALDAIRRIVDGSGAHLVSPPAGDNIVMAPELQPNGMPAH